MTRITVDDALCEQLSKHGTRVESCDASGRFIGEFLPVIQPPAYQGVDSPLSPNELQRRENETEVYTTGEILQRLKE